MNVKINLNLKVMQWINVKIINAHQIVVQIITNVDKKKIAKKQIGLLF